MGGGGLGGGRGRGVDGATTLIFQTFRLYGRPYFAVGEDLGPGKEGARGVVRSRK